MPTLRTEALTKEYGGRTVVRGVSLDVAAGESSGCSVPTAPEDHDVLHGRGPRGA